MKVLLAEPFEGFKKVLKSLLKNFTQDIVDTTSLRETLFYLENLVDEKEIPNLLISSYVLPDGNAIELFRKIRQKEKFASMSLIMCTSEEDPTIYKEALMAGVTKIFLKSKLKEEFKEYLLSFIKEKEVELLSGTIVYVEDSPTYAKIIKTFLRQTKIELKVFSDPEEAYQYILTNSVDLVIIDVILDSKISGIELLEKIRKSEDKCFVPIIVITAFDDPARRVEIFRLGANDYIIKPVLKEEFLVRVKNILYNKRLIEEIKAQREKLKELSFKDFLTGAYNRRILEEFVLKEFEKAKKHGFDLSFIITDIDNFKTINDRHGHIVGDVVLKKISNLLSQKIRAGDFLIRYGGEEFLIILSYCNVDNALKRAEEMRKAIEELNIENLKITASFGVTSLSLHPEANLEELINLADQALYKAKSKGKNRVEIC